jgi:membrane protease YdiL (CAAX protease family)
MTTLADLLYVALFALALPLWDYLFFWPAFRGQSQTDPARARMRLWKTAIAHAWLTVAVGAALWAANGRSWASFGLALPDGWRGWVSAALLLLLAAYFAWAIRALVHSAEVRAGARQQIGNLTSVLPHTRPELVWFGGLSLTAGFCEEFLFRGYFIWALAPWLGWWGAAALSVALFAGWHAYQGWQGVLRTGVVGALFTWVVAMSGSLWPAIALHALLDLGQGAIAWLVLREGQAPDGPA